MAEQVRNPLVVRLTARPFPMRPRYSGNPESYCIALDGYTRELEHYLRYICNTLNAANIAEELRSDPTTTY